MEISQSGNRRRQKQRRFFFAEISQDGRKVKRTQKMLTAYAKNDYAFLADLLPLDNVRHLMDAGGGDGTVARMSVQKWRHLKITILDRADAPFLSAGRENAYRRITKLSGDIFSDWRVAADAVLLASVLHDWNDERNAGGNGFFAFASSRRRAGKNRESVSRVDGGKRFFNLLNTVA